jgi:hypothetical protein
MAALAPLLGISGKTSSSLKLICGFGAVSLDGTTGAGPMVPVADAPPASAMDTPTNPASAVERCAFGVFVLPFEDR